MGMGRAQPPAGHAAATAHADAPRRCQ
jgi:hypothetical protein